MEFISSSEYFCPDPAQGTYADPHKPSTKRHTAQQEHYGTVALGSNEPKNQHLIRSVKQGLAIEADPAKLKKRINNPHPLQ